MRSKTSYCSALIVAVAAAAAGCMTSSPRYPATTPVTGSPRQLAGIETVEESPLAPPSPLAAEAKHVTAYTPGAPGNPTVLPIDLPTVLQLANASNLQIQFARERILAAEAELDRAEALWLPSLHLGTSWTRHDGQIQDTRGEVITVSRNALFVGGGPTATVRLADALYEPLAARQTVAHRVADERATTHYQLLAGAEAYWELVRTQAELAIFDEAAAAAKSLDELAQSYLKAEKLKPADAERIRAEYQLREQEREAAKAVVETASAKLAEHLRLDAFVRLQAAQRVAAVYLVDLKQPARELGAVALGNRPELMRSRAAVDAAISRLRQATYGPFMPNIVVAARGGGFGGGRNDFFGEFDGRSDVEAALVWEFKNLGFGDAALRRQRDSELRQAEILQTAEIDGVLSDVAAAYARAQARRAQLKPAEKASDAAGRSYELSAKLFKDAGIEAIRPIEVVQALQTQVRARQELLNAIIENNRAQHRLHWALGFSLME